MVIFFLQRRGFLPNLQQMHAEGKECTPRMTHGFNTYFFEGDVKSLYAQLLFLYCFLSLFSLLSDFF